MDILKDQQNYEEEIEHINKEKSKNKRNSIKNNDSMFGITQNIQIKQNLKLTMTTG